MPKTKPEQEQPRQGFKPANAIRRLVKSDATGPEIEDKLVKLVRSARQSGKEDELLGALAEVELSFFKNLGAVEQTLLLAGSVGRADEFMEKFNGFNEPGVEAPRWALSNKKKATLKRMEAAGIDKPVFTRLVELKYVQAPASFGSLLEAAGYYAPRIDLPDTLVTALHDNARDKTIDRENYRKRLQQGFAVEQVLTDMYGRDGKRWAGLPRLEDDGKLWHDDAFASPIASGDEARPHLFLTFHGALFLEVKRTWYKKIFPEGVRIGTGHSDKIVSSRVNANGALLEAYRSLVEGNSLLVTVDSPLGTAKNQLKVLGGEMSIADGFVFLAYESKAVVNWVIIVVEDGRLRPRIVRGPSREAGERMSAYRERLIPFINAQITDYVTGAPEQISIPGKWRELVSGDGDTDGEADDTSDA